MKKVGLMTADSQGWWADEQSSVDPAADSITRANGNPISGGPLSDAGWATGFAARAAPVVVNRAGESYGYPDDDFPDDDYMISDYPDAMSRNAADSLAAAVGGPDEHPSPARLLIGLAALAAQRWHPPSTPALATGVGLVARTAADAQTLARRAIRRPAQAVGFATAVASLLPGAGVPRRALARSRDVARRVGADARSRGESIIASGRADASAFLSAGAADAISWAHANAVPQIIDNLVPHLIDEVMPRLIEGAMPEIRNRVLPIVIEDLTKDPRVRDLVVEQGRGVVGEAAQQLRASTANADDRLESAFRRLVRSPIDKPETTGSLEPEPPAGAAPSDGG